ncbi:MAG: rod shape-determining protein MreC [Rhodanobacteraceae bacterium]
MGLAREGISSSLFAANVAGTLRMIAYLGLACLLMVADRQFGLLPKVRYQASLLIEPVFHVAALPASLASTLTEAFADRQNLRQDNRQLRESLMLAEARLSRLQALAEQNRRYRQLLAVKDRLGLKVQVARLVGVDLGPYRHRVMVGVGSNQGVRVGMTVMDAHGVMGQVVEIGRNTAQVMLITDPKHAIPVVDERTNLRVIAHGTGSPDHLQISAIPLSADVRAGDRLVTSGLGGRFPAGFPVARIDQVRVDVDGMFELASATPTANLGKSTDVLLLRDQPAAIGPPAPAASVGPPASLAPGGRSGGAGLP